MIILSNISKFKKFVFLLCSVILMSIFVRMLTSILSLCYKLNQIMENLNILAFIVSVFMANLLLLAIVEILIICIEFNTRRTLKTFYSFGSSLSYLNLFESISFLFESLSQELWQAGTYDTSHGVFVTRMIPPMGSLYQQQNQTKSKSKQSQKSKPL